MTIENSHCNYWDEHVKTIQKLGLLYILAKKPSPKSSFLWDENHLQMGIAAANLTDFSDKEADHVPER
jgi:hypothetical protein